MANLSIVSIFSSTGISNHCFNNILALDYGQSLEILTVVSTIFWPLIIANLSIVSIDSSTGKSNRRFNNFFDVGLLPSYQ